MWKQKKCGATFAPDHYSRRYAIFDRAVAPKELCQVQPLAASRSRTSDMRSLARLETALQWSLMSKHIGDLESPRQDWKLPDSGHQCPYTLATHGCPENNRPYQDNTLSRVTSVLNKTVVSTETTPAPEASAPQSNSRHI